MRYTASIRTVLLSLGLVPAATSALAFAQAPKREAFFRQTHSHTSWLGSSRDRRYRCKPHVQ